LKTKNKNIKILFFFVTIFLFIGIVTKANSLNQPSEIFTELSFSEIKAEKTNVNETTFTEDENDLFKLNEVIPFCVCMTKFNYSTTQTKILKKSLNVFSPPPKK